MIQKCKCGRGNAIHHNGTGTKLTSFDFQNMSTDIHDKAKRGIDVCEECRKDVNAWWLENGVKSRFRRGIVLAV